MTSIIRGFAQGNFITQFEQIFIREGKPIGYAKMRRD